MPCDNGEITAILRRMKLLERKLEVAILQIIEMKSKMYMMSDHMNPPPELNPADWDEETEKETEESPWTLQENL